MASFLNLLSCSLPAGDNRRGADGDLPQPALAEVDQFGKALERSPKVVVSVNW
jgi:hypothetical protein